MASTFVNNLRLNEMATGDASGSWGTNTNINLELIGEALGYGTEAITTNADTHSTVIADGGTDPGRSLYLKYTGTLDSTCTITITPNTCSKVWIVENATSGSQSIVFKQGTGANVTIPNGSVTVCYSDGAGGGAAMYNAFTDLILAGTTTAATLVYTALNDGSTTLTSTVAELNILDGVTSTATELNILDGVTSTTAELNILDGVTSTATELNLLDGVTSTTAELNILDGVTSTAAELNILDGVTSTAAELNILDGVTSTAAELNILDGVTSTTAELNILDGVTSTAAELNILDGVTSTTTELNLVDGITAGTIAASKAVIVDSNKDITGYRNLTSTGTITAATNVTVSSYIRLKSNIETIDNALDKVKTMRGVYFDKHDTENKRSVGVIAQEMQEIIPEAVVTDNTEDKYLSVAYGNLVGVLIEAVKELSDKVEKLEDK